MQSCARGSCAPRYWSTDSGWKRASYSPACSTGRTVGPRPHIATLCHLINPKKKHTHDPQQSRYPPFTRLKFLKTLKVIKQKTLLAKRLLKAQSRLQCARRSDQQHIWTAACIYVQTLTFAQKLRLEFAWHFGQYTCDPSCHITITHLLRLVLSNCDVEWIGRAKHTPSYKSWSEKKLELGADPSLSSSKKMPNKLSGLPSPQVSCHSPREGWFQISESKLANCARMKKEFETSVKCLLKNGEVALGLATAHRRNLTWKLKQVRRSSVADRYYKTS